MTEQETQTEQVYNIYRTGLSMNLMNPPLAVVRGERRMRLYLKKKMVAIPVRTKHCRESGLITFL